MTYWQFVWMQAGMAALILVLSLITVIGHIWTKRSGRRYATRRWYEDRWMSPGIYRLYGDGSSDLNGLQRVVRYVICLFSLYVIWGTIGAVAGVVVLKDAQRSDVFQILSDTRLGVRDYVVYGFFLAGALVHFISIPTSRFLKGARIVLPYFALVGLLLGIVGSVWFERLLLRYATGPCRLFSDTTMCDVLT